MDAHHRSAALVLSLSLHRAYAWRTEKKATASPFLHDDCAISLTDGHEAEYKPQATLTTYSINYIQLSTNNLIQEMKEKKNDIVMLAAFSSFPFRDTGSEEIEAEEKRLV